MSGNLVIKPLTAKLTHSTETFGKMDPYCKVIVGSDYAQTNVHKDGGKTPGWNMTLTLRGKDEDLISFEVWDKDDHSKNDLIGSGTLAVNSVVKSKNKYSDWITLSYKGKSAGTLLVDVEFFPDGGKDKSQQQQQQFIQQPNIYQQGFQQQNVYQQPNIYQQQQQPIYQQQIQQPIYQQQYVQQQPIYQQQQQQPIYQQQIQQPIYQQQQFVQQQPIYQQQQQQQFIQQQQQPIYQQQQVQMQFQQQQQQQYPQQQGGSLNIVFK
jgi:hypothetical protein